jgi:hypothetical protein
MKKNIGTIDKVIRILFAAVIAVLVAIHVVSGAAAIIIGALGTVFLLTSFISFCPLYLPFGISTKKK